MWIKKRVQLYAIKVQHDDMSNLKYFWWDTHMNNLTIEYHIPAALP